MKTLILTCLICSISSHLFGVYNPSAGRFLSRDPIEERGGLNLYSFVSNDPISSIDFYGLKRVTIWASAFIAPDSITFPHPYELELFATWDGDGRTFGPNQSARAWHKVEIETNPAIKQDPIISNNSGSGETKVTFYEIYGIVKQQQSKTAPAPPKANVERDSNNPCLVKVKIVAKSPNPLVPFSPPIDYSYELTFNEATGEVVYRGSHDKFPWHELYIDSKGLIKASPSGRFRNPLDLAGEQVQIPVKSSKF